MKFDPTQMPDWQIADAAEADLAPVSELAARLGILPDELAQYGRHFGKVDAGALLARATGRRTDEEGSR